MHRSLFELPSLKAVLRDFFGVTYRELLTLKYGQQLYNPPLGTTPTARKSSYPSTAHLASNYLLAPSYGRTDGRRTPGIPRSRRLTKQKKRTLTASMETLGDQLRGHVFR